MFVECAMDFLSIYDHYIYIYMFFFFKEQRYYTAADVINKCELSSIFSKFSPILCFIRVVMLMGTQNFFLSYTGDKRKNTFPLLFIYSCCKKRVVSIVINEREHLSIIFVFLPLTKMYRYLGDFCYTCLGYKSG